MPGLHLRLRGDVGPGTAEGRTATRLQAEAVDCQQPFQSRHNWEDVGLRAALRSIDVLAESQGAFSGIRAESVGGPLGPAALAVGQGRMPGASSSTATREAATEILGTQKASPLPAESARAPRPGPSPRASPTGSWAWRRRVAGTAERCPLSRGGNDLGFVYVPEPSHPLALFALNLR